MSLLVIGMHRSGTSAVTGVVNLLGVPTGSRRDLLPPDTFNSQGYWESASLRHVNVHVLARMGGDWASPPVLRSGWERKDDLADLRKIARSAFGRLYPTPPWVWKDPHNCLTLPFWRHLVGVYPVIFVHRNPIDVGLSLRNRDSLSLLFALALWEWYIRAALLNVAGHPVFMTSYERLLEDPHQWCREIRSFITDQGIPVRDHVPQLKVNAFLEAGGRTTRARTSELEDLAVSTSQKELRSLLQGLARRSDPFTAPELPPPTAWGEALLEERRKALLDQRDLMHQLERADQRVLNLRPLLRPLVRPARHGLRRLNARRTALQSLLRMTPQPPEADHHRLGRDEGVSPHADVPASQNE
jgi:hypothetical protein